MITLVLKTALVLILGVALMLVAGFMGLWFKVWPTGLGDYKLEVTPQVISQLNQFLSEKKFVEDPSLFYPGATNEITRASAQSQVDAMLQSVLSGLPSKPYRSFVLREVKHLLAVSDRYDSEELDRIAHYCQRTLEIVGITSSGELINVWRYGFPLGWIVRD